MDERFKEQIQKRAMYLLRKEGSIIEKHTDLKVIKKDIGFTEKVIIKSGINTCEMTICTTMNEIQESFVYTM